MKKIQAILLSISLILLFSCDSSTEKSGDFKLLPLPQEFVITGTSGLEYADITEYFLQSGVEQPVRGKLLKDIIVTKEQSNARII